MKEKGGESESERERVKHKEGEQKINYLTRETTIEHTKLQLIKDRDLLSKPSCHIYLVCR